MNAYTLYKSYGYRKMQVVARGLGALELRKKKQEKTAKLYTTKTKNGDCKADYIVRQFDARTIQTARNYQWIIESPYMKDLDILEDIHNSVCEGLQKKSR